MHDDLPHLRWGDAVFKMRYSSLKKYSHDLANSIYGFPKDVKEPWNVKRLVKPAELGVHDANGVIPVHLFVFLTLDSDSSAVASYIIDGTYAEELFLAKIGFHTSMAETIRGGYAPLNGALRSVPFFVPSMDCLEFLNRRIIFIESLFDQRAIVRIRGPLKHVTDFLTQLFADS